MRTLKSALIAATVVMPAAVRSQVPDTLSLAGRHYLAVGIGLTGARESLVSGGQVNSHSTGQVASFAFTHFVRPELAIEISTGAIDADSKTGFGAVQTDGIIPLLFGLSYSPEALALSSSLRPYVSVAAGPYFHMVSDESAASGVKSSSSSVIGGRAGAGVNWFVSRHFMLQLEGDYHAVGKFEPVNGVRKDPSGFSMAVGFGFAWGR